MIEGIKVKIGEREYVIPPLNLKRLKALQAQIEFINSIKPTEVFTEKYYDAMADVVHAAVTRNHPEVSRDEIEEGLDLGNIKAAYHATMNVSGLVKKLGEEKGPESR